jgi:type I restriction enzyme S subunit
MSIEIDWMGGLTPSSWKIFKLKHVLREEQKEVGRDLPAGSISFGEVVFKNFENNETLATYRTVRRGQFLINPLNLNYDLKSLRIGLSEIDCRVSPAYIVASNQERISHANYLRWALRVFDVQHIKTLGAGVRQTVKFEDIGGCRIALPDIDHQKTIANYLNRATTRIDALVSKKTRFIELLREKRQATIALAVAKGLDANVPLKDSGVEWLGKVPEHWNIFRFKVSAISCQNGLWGSDPNGLDDIECVRVADFDRHALRVNDQVPTLRAITQRERTGRLLRRGNLLLEKSGGGEKQPVGQVVIYDRDQEAICSNFVAKVVLSDGMDSRFWNYQHHAAYAARINVRSIKQTSGIQNLDQHQYLNEMAAFPPYDEQKAIAMHLDRTTSRIEALINKTERSIELLREHRTALITAAVTGKIDLREAA